VKNPANEKGKSDQNKEENLWLLELIKNSDLITPHLKDSITTKASKNMLCVACKGSRTLCGKTRCPIIVKLNAFFKTVPLIQSIEIDGSSPPSVFIGRIGYPYVYAGPLVPPIHEDTSFYDIPELWFGKSIDEITAFRSMLIRGKHRVHVKEFENAGKIMENTQELALAVNPVDVELTLKKRPHGFFFLDDNVQPFGPSAPIQNLRVSSAKWDYHIQKAYYDRDLKAADAIIELYTKGVLVTKIQRALSVGAFGLNENRRLIPTRWSITAVDSIISEKLMEKIKTFPEINEYRVYESHYLDNIFEILMIPDAWSYEAIEAWYPGTVWNPNGSNIVLFSDWEEFNGRTTYAEIGGCYYAARLAVCEQLLKERRQATVIVLREAHPGYIMPVGVWQVRENVRNAMKQQPLKFYTLDEALGRIASQFKIPLNQWIKESKLLQKALFQKKLTEYFQKRIIS